MCNYEIEMDLLLNGTVLKPCDFETEEVVERKGTRKSTNHKLRIKATEKAKARHKKNLLTVYGYESINRGENGKTSAQNSDEWLATIVATKKNGKSTMLSMYKKMDRRKLRHEGKAECNRYIPETDFDDFDDSENEEIYEGFPEKADGTIDLDEYLHPLWDDDDYWDDNDYIDDVNYLDDDDYYYDKEESIAEENFWLKREINLYKDFIGEFNLNKLYETWLAQNKAKTSTEKTSF